MNGNVSPSDTSADLAVTLTGFALPLLQPYVDAASGATLRQGDLGMEVSVRHRGTGESATTSCEGRIDLTSLDVGTRSGADVLRLEALTVEGLSATLAPKRCAVPGCQRP